MAKMRRCPNCGRLISSSSPQCKYCDGHYGHNPSQQERSQKSNQIPAPQPVVPEYEITETDSEEPFSAEPQNFTTQENNQQQENLIPEDLNSQQGEDYQALPENQPVPNQVEPPSQYPPQGYPPQNQQPSGYQQPPGYQQPSGYQQPQYPYPEGTPPVVPPQNNMDGYDYMPPPKKSNNSLIAGLIIGIALIAVTVAVIFSFVEESDNDSEELIKSPSRIDYEEGDSVIITDSIVESEDDGYDMSGSESVNNYESGVKDYNINTIVSGYPIIMKFTIDDNGVVSGKYAYKSTLKKYGDVPSHWFKIEGHKYGSDLSLIAYHPEYGAFEEWTISLSGSGSNAKVSGTIINNKKNEMYYVGSSQAVESMEYSSFDDYDSQFDEY